MRSLALVLLLGSVAFAGCASTTPAPDGLPQVADTAPPFLAYVEAMRAPDMALNLLMEEALVTAGDLEIHVRVVRPETTEKVPAIVEFTPYTAGAGSVGTNPMLDGLVEPIAGCQPVVAPCDSTFDTQFVRRGYAFAYADVRGTGDSSGCLDLRGAGDIADAAEVIEWLGTQPWSNGKVGFIGASYPGSEAHIAALAEAGAKTGHLGGVIPVVASTSFYNYHHNGGVPYNGNHALGGTNTGYTSNAVAPTLNAQNPNYILKQLDEPACPLVDNVVTHGGLDQSGAYNDWWAERNLRGRAGEVGVPVLMAQGLADWNVKPDHIATYFNDLDVQKTLIAGQWPHQYPRSKGDCAAYAPDATPPCDPAVPWGDWWAYATAFFDTTLKGLDTGMFTGDVAWVQDNAGTWHRSSEWPLSAETRESLTFHIHPATSQSISTEPHDGTLLSSPYDGAAKEIVWYGCPHDQQNRGTQLSAVEALTVQCDDELVQELVFETPPFAADTFLSGVPRVNLTLTSDRAFTHLTVVVDRLDASGVVIGARENYGYLNPTYRNGVDAPAPVPTGTPYLVSIPLYPQEDVVKAGERLRVAIASNDGGRTIESYEEGTNALQFGPGVENSLWLPVRPAALQGVRLG
ncbi:MAG: CocE/NonD family hydrolase [Candidatus Thermoplasmatota archaeon]